MVADRRYAATVRQVFFVPRAKGRSARMPNLPYRAMGLLSYSANNSTAFSFSSFEYISYPLIVMIQDRFSSASLNVDFFCATYRQSRAP